MAVLPIMKLMHGQARKFQTRRREQSAAAIGELLDAWDMAPEFEAGIRDIAATNPQAALAMIREQTQRDFTAQQNANATSIDHARLSQQAAKHRLDVEKHEEQMRQWEHVNSPEYRASEAELQMMGKGQMLITDPRSGGKAVVPMQETAPWLERVDLARIAERGLQISNAYRAHISEFGLLRQGDKGFGTQDALRTELVTLTKSREQLGALDQGVLSLVGRLFGDPDDPKQFFLGDDAEVLARVNQATTAFESFAERKFDEIRLLPGVQTEEYSVMLNALQGSQQATAAFSSQVEQLRAGTGLIGREPIFSQMPSMPAMPAGPLGPSMPLGINPKAAMDFTRGVAATTGIDNLIWSILGLGAGAMGRKLL